MYLWKILALGFVIGTGYAASLSGQDLSGQEVNAAQVNADVHEVDVETQIWPIFRNRCLRCHRQAPGNAKEPGGGFRIDTIEGIRAGGHTSNSILGQDNDPDNSELIRRLVSEDENYRMPEGEIPLPKSQVELIRNWIQEGASWPAGGVLEPQPESVWQAKSPGFSGPKKSAAEVWLDIAVDVHGKIQIALAPLIVFLIGMLWIERRKKQLQQRPRSADAVPSRLDRVALTATGAHYLCGYLLILIFAGVNYHVRRLGEVSRELEKVLAKAQENPANRASVAKQVAHAIPEPHRPKHPPQLGGIYYRGNDERSDKLFNGGYYRTATMRLSLRDQGNRQLAWGDRLETDRCFVYLEIEKAPYTTSELFNARIFEACVLSRSIPGVSTSQFDEPPVFFNATDSTDRWFASYEVADISKAVSDLHVSGLIYLYNNGTTHFGIRYDIRFRDRVVTKGSELWMGAILLPPNAIVPQENEITLTEWFDFLPIPEITEPNTDDPVLLGIPEHVKK